MIPHQVQQQPKLTHVDARVTAEFPRRLPRPAGNLASVASTGSFAMTDNDAAM
jgi:hypothetical protein